MENLWTKAHQFILDCNIGDYYMEGDKKVSVVRRSPKRIYFSNGELITIKKSQYGFFYLGGRNIDQILRDIEGYFIYQIHDPMFYLPFNIEKKIFGKFYRNDYVCKN